MSIKIAYKFEIFPTLEQQTLINKTIGCCRFVWNWALGKKIEAKKCGEELTWGQLSKMLTELKKQHEYQWLNEVNAQALVAELNHLRDAFTRFFNNVKQSRKTGKKRKGKNPFGFPRFKKRGRKESFSNQQTMPTVTPCNRVELSNNPKHGFLTIRKIVRVPICVHRPIFGRIGTVTISRTASGRYFASMCCTVSEENPSTQQVISESEVIGIDRGIKSLAVCSNGRVIKNPKHLTKSLAKLAALQRKLQKKRDRSSDWKTSKRYAALKRRVARVHEHVAWQRSDTIHKATHELTNLLEVSAIGIEDLSVSGIVQSRRFGHHASDASMGEFGRQIKYKAEREGKTVVEVDRFFPSSKTCSACGHVLDSLPETIRKWICPICDAEHDRDLNAAVNIRKESWRKLQG